jgi:FixJ family two-component response regulator
MIGTPSTVFVVDDDASVRRAIERLLRAAGYRVECYPSAHQFLQHVTTDRAGCLVLDVRMPGQGGFALLDALKIERPHVPIVLIAGHGDARMAKRARDVGAVDFLAKPFEDQRLLDAVVAALEIDRLRRESPSG